MTEKEMFTIVGIRPEPVISQKKKKKDRDFPWISVIGEGTVCTELVGEICYGRKIQDGCSAECMSTFSGVWLP